MATPQRKLHSLEGIVAACALFFVLAISVGFARADSAKPVFLRSSSALVQDAETGDIVIAKNSDAVVPIASITKLMTAMVILDRGLDLEQRIVLSREDVDSVKGTRSRLRTGTVLTRDELLLLALMASENRAAAALGRTYPGGMPAFVTAMNAKSDALGMTDSHFVEPTGLSPANVASARDLAKLVRAAHAYPLIREYSTRGKARVMSFGRPLPRHARAHGGKGADRGAPRLLGQTLPDRRRQPHPQVAREEHRAHRQRPRQRQLIRGQGRNYSLVLGVP